ncbi:putative lipid II flippase FtsW [Francisellaceae bacterium]|nr:putative lipid II flippase FtsW [Francisellaceae bacterium]
MFMVLLLLAFGFIMVTSASLVDAKFDYGNPYYFVIRQVIFTVMALIAMGVALFIPIDNYQRLGRFWLVIAFILLIAVLIPGIGHSVNGSRRWIPLVFINVQVSEVVKLCAIMYFSSYLVKYGDYAKHDFWGVMKPIAILACMAVLLLLEPDFGASVVMFTAIFGIMFMAGVSLRWFALLILTGGGAAITLVLQSPYRLARLTGFSNPWADAYGSGYQLTQSLIGFGRGGWFGLGLGNSIQKLYYLPEAHTDFILSIIAEELGAVGVIVLLVVYGILVWRGLQIARVAQELGRLFEAYICYGITFWFVFQVLVNMGVNIGVLPTKGLTLPLISYGGSSMLILCFALGIMLRIDFENRLMSDTLKPKFVRKKK